MKKININIKNIHTLFAFSLVIILSLSYIVFIYKTVVIASKTENNNEKIFSLNNKINQKEFDYIEKISSIDMNKAVSLGYVKNTENKIAYFNIRNNSEFAIR